MDSPHDILKETWGHDHFRLGQEAIIEDLIKGKDVFALLPTGGGKSICYQIPGIIKEGVTLVISPLISLMQDQVEQLVSRGIKAAALYGGMSYREIDITLDNAKFGSYDFLYLSPERLETQIFIERFKAMNVSQIIIDEAHCISQWGHDFRPSYSKISKLREFKPNLTFAAFTATANEKVKTDIINELNLKDVRLHQSSFQRPNIAYRAFYTHSKKARVLEFCLSLKNSCGIIYCQTRRGVREIESMLKSEGVSCGMYHGGMKNTERKKSMQQWMQNHNTVMVATNAFGMGIDKPDVRYVIHYDTSDSIEAYFQESGRGGRDQQNAIALLFYNEKDIKTLKKNVAIKFPDTHKIAKLYSKLFQHFNIAYGDGKDQVVEINIQEFATQHELETLLVYHGLKILELNGDLSLSESVFHPAKIKLMVGTSELYNFEIQHASLKDLTQFLIRNFSGVFDLYKKIDIDQIAKLLKSNRPAISKKLEQLHLYGICDFIPASTEPTIGFLRNRSQNDVLLLHPTVYGIRKNNYESQINSVIDFLKGESCRTQYLLAYFGEVSDPCNTCDKCVSEKNKKEVLSDKILTLLDKPSTIATLMNQTGAKEIDIIENIDYLQEEEKITIENHKVSLIS